MSQSNSSQSTSSDSQKQGLIFSDAQTEPRFVEGWKDVSDLGDLLDDHRLIAELGYLSAITSDHLPYEQTQAITVTLDVLINGEPTPRAVRINEPTLDHLRVQIKSQYPHITGDSFVRIAKLILRRTAQS